MPLSIHVDARSMELLKPYLSHDGTSPYLLCFLDGRLEGAEAYREYQRLLRLLNLRLSQLSRSRRTGCRASSYTARHTWATSAKHCGIAVEVISEALGHASVTTTEGYLKLFDDSILEKANELVMNYIFK